jgi:hypothetical protein
LVSQNFVESFFEKKFFKQKNEEEIEIAEYRGWSQRARDGEFIEGISRRENFYEPNAIATISLKLRRSVHRSVILIIRFDVYDCDRIFFLPEETHPGSFLMEESFISPLRGGDGFR